MTRSFPFLLILLLIPVLPVTASGARVWGMETDTFAANLSSANHEFLRHIPIEEHRLREVDRLGEDASYALGLIYRELGLSPFAEELLLHSWSTAPEPYRSRALGALLPLLERPGAAERRRTVAELLAAEEPLWQQTLLTRIYYEDQDYAAVLSRGRNQLSRARAELGPASLLRQELELWVAVSTAMTEREQGAWRRAFHTLYSDYPATSIHSRLYLFLLFQDELRAEFDDSELRFFRAKQLLAEGEFSEASVQFRELAAGRESAGRKFMLTPYGIFDFFRAAAAAGDTLSARSLEVLARELDGLPASRALEYSGRVLRTAGAPSAAVRPLERALERLPAGSDDQRIRWYLWSSRVRSDAGAAAAGIGAAVATFERPGYYSDLFAELGDRLIGEANWAALLTAYRGIEEFAEPEVLARYQLVLALLYRYGVLASTPARALELQAELLRSASEQSGDRFSALVAATLLGEDGVAALGLTEAPSAPDGADRDLSDAALLADTYFTYGLFDALEAHLRRSGPEIDPSRAQAYARGLHDLDRFPAGIVATNSISAAAGELTRERATLRYPRAYASIIDRVADAEMIDRWTFYALVREESLFQSAVTSVAGAQGLAQLMPATADDIARRMRLGSFDLAEPSDNLAIGARYFGMLSEQFQTPSRAIAAYNGGQGNVRLWERRWGGDEELLFHQRIPFPETFNHVRKVVVSAAYYGYLYAERSPAQSVVRLFALPEE